MNAKNIKTRVARSGWQALILVLTAHGLAGGETYLTHFVAPKYPQLAVQAMAAGRVSMDVLVGTDGRVKDVVKKGDSSPFLSEPAAQTVREWTFNYATVERTVSVSFFYSFSGRPRSSDRETVVRADFEGSIVRVFVTTDNLPLKIH